MKYVIDVPEEMITSSGELLFHYKNTKDLTYQMYTGINVIPYTEPDEIKNNKVNLCSSCELYKEHFPECGDINVLFGDGVINDNICCCSGYVAKNEDEIRQKVEDEVWEFASDICHNRGNILDILKIKIRTATAVFDTYYYPEAKAEYEEWKKHKSEVHLYDEIVSSVTNVKATIINISSWGQWNCINVDGAFNINADQQILWEKTGRSFPEFGKLLKKMEVCEENER